jgi:hypothetical protein
MPDTDEPPDWSGACALYCCVPHRRDADQLPIDVQERNGRARAAESGGRVPADLVFVDRRRSVWEPGAERPGWARLLAAIRGGRVPMLLMFRPATLIHYRAADMVELLTMANEHAVAVRGFGDVLSLSDSAGRQAALALALHRCDAAAAVSQNARSSHRIAADAGRPHGGGRRAYGYESGMRALIPYEAEVVREIYTRYLAYESLRAIAADLNARDVPTSGGSAWTTTAVTRILTAPRYAGLLVFRGSIEDENGDQRLGTWEPCISVETWQQAQQERTKRTATASPAPKRADYPLTGIVLCGRCEDHMVGSIVGDYRMYACGSVNKTLSRECNRHIAAASLEKFVEEAAVDILRRWDTLPSPDGPVTVWRGPAEARSADPAARFWSTHGQIEQREIHALDGVVTGSQARRAWRQLPAERKTAVLRVLFAAIVIGPKTTPRGVFDTSRITLIRDHL